jgi:hypothetical protein
MTLILIITQQLIQKIARSKEKIILNVNLSI